MEKINVAELLKDCPKGMEFDCLLCNNPIALEGVAGYESYFPIRAVGNDGFHHVFTKYGTSDNHEDAKCVIFPKGKTTWEGFQRPFKDGDILYIYSAFPWIFIYKEGGEKENVYYKYVAITSSSFVHDCSPICHRNNVKEIRHATEEEKQKLFQAIKDHGYKWNPETKSLEELVEPKFKVGDRIKLNNCSSIYTITALLEDKYRATVHSYDLYEIEFERQDAYKLVPNKFDINTLKPFDKVLVRSGLLDRWRMQFFEKYDETDKYPFICMWHNKYNQCVPYEGNERLLGTTDDCDEYFKTWK